MNKYSDYNIIPIGDHCAISIILKELHLRNKSYPFDWVDILNPLYATNIIYNIEIINELMTENNVDNIDNIVKKYVGNAPNDINRTNINNNIHFPHDTENANDVFEKYKRRFQRLQSDLSKKNIFVLVTRHYYIEKEIFEQMIKQLLSYNSESIILFIGGTNHPYFEDMNHPNVIFKYIEYDISKFYDYDYIGFRPNIKKYLSELLL